MKYWILILLNSKVDSYSQTQNWTLIPSDTELDTSPQTHNQTLISTLGCGNDPAAFHNPPCDLHMRVGAVLWLMLVTTKIQSFSRISSLTPGVGGGSVTPAWPSPYCCSPSALSHLCSPRVQESGGASESWSPGEGKRASG